MHTYECPNCSGPAPLHASTVFAVCKFCQSMLLREGVNLSLLGKAATLPPDISPIQIGAQGMFGERGFTVLGRVRYSWADGFWNEWFIEFGDGSKGWLAESQGFFIVSREQAPGELPKELKPGKRITLAGVELRVVDIKRARVAGAEGELPFAAKPDSEKTSADLNGPNSIFASIEVDDHGTQCFLGRYCHFADLQFSNLRPVPGWFGNLPLALESGVQALNCPDCSAAVTLKAPGQTVTVTCPSCGCVLDASQPKVSVIRHAFEVQNLVKPLIPLGARGVLFGVEYEVMGFMLCVEEPYGWYEYLLFNPHHGYTWLVNFSGHWNFVERLLETPRETADEAIYNGRGYDIFLRGTATVRYVLGEFYWRVTVGGKSITTDYIAPPYILSKEEYPQLKEVTWSHGQYLESEELVKAFGLTARLQEPAGVYMNQPNPWSIKHGFLGATAGILILLLLLIQIVSVSRARNQAVATQPFTYLKGETNRSTPAMEFELKGGRQPVAITSSAILANSWAEFNYELQGIETGERRRFTEGLENYSGTANRRKTTFLPSVRAGKYRLLVDPVLPPEAESVTYEVQIRADPPVWRNFWICLAMLLAYPIYRFLRARVFEHARWAESDYGSTGLASVLEGDDE